MRTVIRRFPIPCAILGMVVAMGSAVSNAQSSRRLAKAELFFELNDTDGDLGIHASIDGEPWTDLVIRGPARGRGDVSSTRDDDDDDGRLLSITAGAQLRAQGLTEVSFESAEPSFDELAPADFFRRFPEGRYEIVAQAKDGGRITGTATLSHVMAAPPGNVRVNRSRAADSCDDPLPTVIAPVTVDWDPVTRSHPDIGKQGPVVVELYQFFVEHEDVTFGVDLPPDVTEFEIPEAVTEPGGEFKFEIIARTEDGNNTAIESCFVVHQ